MLRWDTEIVALLVELRAMGERDFDRAWRLASRIARERGLSRPRDFTGHDGETIPFSTWYREACRREWCGLVAADFQGLRELLMDPGVFELASAPRSAPQLNPARAVLLA